MLSRWRSSIISRSKVAIAPIIVSISRPVAVDVSIFEDAQSGALSLDRLNDGQVMSGRAGQSVELGHDQDIALADVVRGGIELGPGSDTGHLLVNSLSAPEASRSRISASKPAACSKVLERAYPLITVSTPPGASLRLSASVVEAGREPGH
jgi:hypothetical protein